MQTEQDQLLFFLVIYLFFVAGSLGRECLDDNLAQSATTNHQP